MYCQKCGTKLLGGAKFCQKCGFPVEYSETVLVVPKEQTNEINEQLEEPIKEVVIDDSSQQNEKVEEEAEEKEELVLKTWPSILSGFSFFVLLISFMFIFAGIHSEIRNNNILVSLVPAINEKLVINIPAFTKWSRQYLDSTGIFGTQLILLFSLLQGLSRKHSKHKSVCIIKTAIITVCFLIVMYHFVLQYNLGFSMFTNMIWYIAIAVVYAVVGELLAIIRKIFKI